MGKVKTEQIKRVGQELMERFPDRFTTKFDENKRLVEALTEGTTTRVRNQIAGYITRTKSLAHANAGNDLGGDEEEETE